MRLSRLPINSPVIFTCVALGLSAVGGDRSLQGQNDTSSPISQFPICTGTHVSKAEFQSPIGLANTSEIPAPDNIEIPAPTRSSFMASWPGVSGAIGYLLDVSTSSSFDSYVDGYNNLDVGNVRGRVVTGLHRGTTYYYRVRAYSVAGMGGYSDVKTAKIATTAGLVIHATFDSSITSNPNAAAIEAMINRAISIYESRFSDPITIEMLFRYATTGPDGTPLPAGSIAQSNFVIYTAPWSVYINELIADAKTSNDNLANASLPVNALSANIVAA